MILYKTRNNRVVKKQYGGTMPVYGSYQVQHSQQAPYNPAGLLAKYQGAPAAQAGTTTQKAKKEWKIDGDKVEGLTGDVNAFMAGKAMLEQRIQQGIMENPNFADTSVGLDMLNQYNYMHTKGLNDLKQNEQYYDESTKILEDNHGGEQWVFQDGYGLVSYIDPDGEYRTGFVPAEEAIKRNEDGSPKYEKISYERLAMDRETGRVPEYINDVNMSTMIRQGLGMDKVFSDWLKPVFTGLGHDSEKNTYTAANTEIDGEMLDKYQQGVEYKNNTRAIKSALHTARKNLMGSPAWQTLQATAYSDSRVQNEADAMQWIDNYLVATMKSHLVDETGTTEILDWDEGFYEDLYGDDDSGTDKIKKQSPTLMEQTGDGLPVKPLKVEGTRHKEKTTTQTMPAWEASHTETKMKEELKKEHKVKYDGTSYGALAPVTKLTALTSRGSVRGMMTVDGTNIGATKDAKKMAWVGDDVLLTKVLVDGAGKPVSNVKQKEYKKKMKALEDEFKDTLQTNRAKTNYESAKKALYKEVFGGKDVYVQTMYTTTLMYNKHTLYHKGKSYLYSKAPKISVTDDEAAAYYYHSDYTNAVEGSGYGGEHKASYGYNKVRVFLPLQNTSTVRVADGLPVYTDQGNTVDTELINKAQGDKVLLSEASVEDLMLNSSSY